jgi:hypothetical protein
VAIALLVALPAALRAADRPADPLAPPRATAPQFDPSPLPPIEPARDEKHPPPADPSPAPSVEPDAEPTPAPEREPSLEQQREQVREETGAAKPEPIDAALGISTTPEKRAPGCLLLQVGLFASNVDPGLAADIGLRVRSFSARWAYRLMLAGSMPSTEVALSSWRLAWHREFTQWIGGYVGAGVGSLKERSESYWSGQMEETANATVLTFDAGLLVEAGPVSILGLGVELLSPMSRGLRSTPTMLMTVTVNPFVLLRALK